MLGWKLVPKRELLLWTAQIQDLKNDIKRLREERDRERQRAEAAINMVLMKTQQVAITPETKPPDQAEISRLAFDIFNDSGQADKLKEEQAILDRIQS